MKNIYFIFLLLVMAGCIPTVPSNNGQSSNYQSMSNSPLAEIEFLDMSTFDSDLSNSMAASLSTITVTTISPITVNDIPDRLEKWLAAVRENGGTISIEPKTKSITSVIGLLFSVLDSYSSLFSSQFANTYSAAINYNAIIAYRPESGIINTIRFVRK